MMMLFDGETKPVGEKVSARRSDCASWMTSIPCDVNRVNELLQYPPVGGCRAGDLWKNRTVPFLSVRRLP